ncbi:hypothetical protein EJB05_40085, partial [Eragrostis curvula]
MGRDAICGEVNAWFGISEVPITAKSVRDEREVLKAVEHVHELLDKEVAAGTDPSNIFVCGLSQGGALAIASVLLYPKTLGGCVVFSGSIPLNKTFAETVSSEARKAYPTLGHSLVDEELKYLQQWINGRLGISEGTETARPSSSSHHKDPE